MSNLSPVPAVPLRDDPTQDSVWKRWLQQLNNKVGGTYSVADGGTGITSYTIGDIIYASATDTLSKLPAAATGNALLSGTAPSWGKITILHIKPDILAFAAAHG